MSRGTWVLGIVDGRGSGYRSNQGRLTGKDRVGVGRVIIQVRDGVSGMISASGVSITDPTSFVPLFATQVSVLGVQFEHGGLPRNSDR